MHANTDEPQGLDGMVWIDGDRRIVRFHRRFDVTPMRLWAAMTHPELVAGWLGPVQRFDLRVGGEIVLLLHPGKGAWLRGTVLDVEVPHRLEFTWTVPAHGSTAEFTGSTLRLEVHPDGAGSRLAFAHFLPDADRVFDILAASHLRLNQLPSVKGQSANVDREAFLAMRARYQRAHAAIEAWVSMKDEERTECEPS